MFNNDMIQCSQLFSFHWFGLLGLSSNPLFAVAPSSVFMTFLNVNQSNARGATREDISATPETGRELQVQAGTGAPGGGCSPAALGAGADTPSLAPRTAVPADQRVAAGSH